MGSVLNQLDRVWKICFSQLQLIFLFASFFKNNFSLEMLKRHGSLIGKMTEQQHGLSLCRYRYQRVGQGGGPGPAQDDEGRRRLGLLHRGRSHRQADVFHQGRRPEVKLKLSSRSARVCI